MKWKKKIPVWRLGIVSSGPVSVLFPKVPKKPNKAKVVSLTERLKPLFKAAAVVAIIMTLGNAVQTRPKEPSTNPKEDRNHITTQARNRIVPALMMNPFRRSQT